jgi:hypothetical protein
LRIGKKSTGTRVHRGNQHEARRVVDRSQGACDGNISVFEGLAHNFQNVALELGQFVQE